MVRVVPFILLPVLIPLLYYALYGLRQVLFILIVVDVLFVYVLWRICVHFINAHFFHDRSTTVSAGHLAVSLLRLGAIAGAFLLVVAFSIWYVTVTSAPASRADIAGNNNILMQADKVSFGIYVPFWLQETTNPWKPLFDIASPVLIGVYSSLWFFLGFMLVLLLIKDDRLFVDMFLSCLLCLLLAAPLWYVFPALSPSMGYWHPIIPLNSSFDVQPVLALYAPNETLLSYLKEQAAIAEGFPDWFLAITTIPSLHVAWGALFVYFAVRAWLPLAIIAVPYFLLNSLSAVYTLQHYAVDIPAGIFVAVVALFTIQFLRLNRSRDVTLLHELLRDDLRRFWNALRSERKVSTPSGVS
jgi:hypothetical protein